MSIRLRIILSLILIGILPMLTMATGLYLTIAEVQDRAIAESQQALELSGQQAILEKANAVADQIALYLKFHPEINPRDYATLENNEELRAIAVSPVGQTGYTAVHDRMGVNHFHINPAVVGTNLSGLADRLPQFWSLIGKSLSGQQTQGYYDWLEPDGITIRQKFMVIVPVEGTDLLVAATTYIDEFSAPANSISASLSAVIGRSLLSALLIILAGTSAAFGLAFVIGNRLTSPLIRLTEAARNAEAGQVEISALDISRNDEIGALAKAFDKTTRQLRETIDTLEQRVAERTTSLSRRAAQIQAAAEVGAAATSLRDTETLLNEATHLIADRFGYYHVGIFLLDERGEFAELRAANSDGGRNMLERGHRLKVGETGIVGYVAARGQARIALDVGDDAVYFDNPDLPETRSEMALPLRIGTRIIGALDVQSKDPSAFSEDDIATLRVLADQIAVAIENARLLSESRAALQAERRAYGEISRIAWERLSRSAELQGYIGTDRGEIAPIEEGAWPAAMQEAVTVGETRLDRKTNNLHIPRKVRGVTIGAIRLQKPEQAAWTEGELATVETLSEQLGIALDSARQYRETQERADRERQINLLAGEVRSAISTESILQNTVRELGKALGATRAFIQLGSLDDSAEAGKAE